MTKEEVLQKFFSGFGIPAYPTTAVPDDAVFPFLTYEAITDDWTSAGAAITVNLWYYTTDESVLNAKAREIGEAIAKGDPISCDGGFVWFIKGHPWSQPLQDDNDSNIKRRYINVTVKYMTEY